ncbi:hypothetical protein N2152v2_000079 [Parachlorella kessleri]
MSVEEVFRALCPGARILDTAETAPHLAKRRVLADLAVSFFSKLSAADPEEATLYARRCATLFAKLLPRLRENRGAYGPEALPSFVVLGLKRLSDEGTDEGACRSTGLRVLAKLVRAADREPALRAETSSRRSGVARRAGAGPLQTALLRKRAKSCAGTAVSACSSASPEVERMFLLSAGRLHLLPERLIARERSLGAPPGELLSMLDRKPVMLCNVQLVQRLLRFAFVRKTSETPAAGEGEGSLPSMLPAEAIAGADAEAGQPQLLVALRELLRSLHVFLCRGMQLAAFVEGQGTHVLLAVLLAGVSEDNNFPDALVDSKCRCLCQAAECLITALVVSKEAAAALTSAGGCQQLLNIVHDLPLCRVAEAYVDNGHPGWWQLLCMCLSVLELAIWRSKQAREEFLRAGGIKALLRASRWDPSRSWSCQAPLEVRARAEGRARAGGLQDILRAVATRALSALGELYMRAGSGSDARGQLASLITLEELEQYARLAPPHSSSPGQSRSGRIAEQPRREVGFVDSSLGVEGMEGAPEQMGATSRMLPDNRADSLRAKYSSSLDLSLGVAICTQALLDMEGGQGEIMLDAYPHLYEQVLILAGMTTSDATVLPHSVAFRILAAAMRGKAACQRLLLQDRVHLTAGTVVTSALTHIKEQARAAQLSRRAPARGKLAQGPVVDAIAQHCALILNVTLLLDGLRQAGDAGQTAAQEVVKDGQLEKAAVGAAFAFSSPDPTCEAAGLYLKEFLSWANELLRQNGGMMRPGLQAEAAAASLLAEEEAAQRKAAAKAAKRQRQKAAMEQAKQQALQVSQQQATAPAAAAQQGSSGEPRAAAGPWQRLDATIKTAQGQPSRKAKVKKPLQKLEHQQRDMLERPLNDATAVASSGSQLSGGGSLPPLLAASGSSKQASPAIPPLAAVPAVHAPGTPARQQGLETRRAGIAALPSTPAAAPPLELGATAAAPPQDLPVPAVAEVSTAPAADEHEAEHQALLELLLPGITLGKHSQQPEPPVSNPAPPAAAVTSPMTAPAGLGSSTAGAGQHGSAMPPATLAAVLVCALTGKRLTDPVIAADGYTYERQALAAWLQRGSSQSPVTGRAMAPGLVRPNFAVRELLPAS